jgi:FlaA1/EpsC-like NDP-sugar epimerase
VPVIYAMLALVLLGGLRFAMRQFLLMGSKRPRTRVIIYGAGASGRQLQLSLVNGPEYLPVAFVDDDSALQGRFIGNCQIFRPEDLPQIIRDYAATTLLLAMPSVSRGERARVLHRIGKLPIQIQTIPGIADLVSGRTQINEISDVPVEDLLGRDPVPPRPELMDHDIRGRVVMVTGAGGSIGSELCRQIIDQGPQKLVLFEQSEFNLYAIDQEMQSRTLAGAVEIVPIIGSVQNTGRVTSALRDHGVETIYHAAAYKHVPLVERNVVEGVRNNVFGTQDLVEAAVATGVKAFILISTDKAVRPTNVMGASKRMAELVCQAMAAAQPTGGTRISMVRFGNVLGSSGSVIPLFRRQIAAGGPVTVTHPDITRYFMTIPEAAQLVIQAGAMSKGGDVFVLDMGEPVRISDLAQRMIQLSGLKPVLIPPGATARPIGEDGDIEVRFSGLRPGEKLYEELLVGENAEGTGHPRIMTAHETFLTLDQLAPLLERLKQHCLAHDVPAIRALLSEAPTGYATRQSLPA